MPKTASKRAKARHVARVTRAHQTTFERETVRRARPVQKSPRKTGLAGVLQRYPLASTFFALLVVGGIVWTLYANHVGPFARPKPVVHQPTCNLTTHVCAKPNMTINMNKLYVATIHTAKGDIVIQMNPKNAPQTVNNFVYLATQHFYDGLTFWRVDTKGQPSVVSQGQPSSLDVIQGGDPKGDGSGGAGYSFKDEPVVGDYVAGAVAMANSGPNTNGSQFFICTGDDTGALAKSYNLFGQVVSGLNVAQQIKPGDKMLSVTITEQALPTPTPGTPTAGPSATPAGTTTPSK